MKGFSAHVGCWYDAVLSNMLTRKDKMDLFFFFGQRIFIHGTPHILP